MSYLALAEIKVFFFFFEKRTFGFEVNLNYFKTYTFLDTLK